MRDILKLHSGTQSGTPVSPPKIAKKRSFFVRGKDSKEESSKNANFRHKNNFSKISEKFLKNLVFRLSNFTI